MRGGGPALGRRPVPAKDGGTEGKNLGIQSEDGSWSMLVASNCCFGVFRRRW